MEKEKTQEWIHVEGSLRGLFSIFKKGKIGESYNIGSEKYKQS